MRSLENRGRGLIFTLLVMYALTVSAATPWLARACSVLNVPTTEYPTVQAAVDSAAACDTIMLAPGTYTGEGNREIDFHGKSLVLTSSHGADSTIFSCGDYSAFNLHGTEDTTTVISDVTLRDSYNTALRCSSDGLRLLRVKIMENRGDYGFAGGLSLGTGDYLISECLFHGNTIIDGGGGVAIRGGGTVHIERSTISNNSTRDGTGGAIWVGGDMTIVDSIIRNNDAVDAQGGAIYVFGTLKMIRCEIRGNYAEIKGGAIKGPVALMKDCLAVDNRSGNEGSVVLGVVDSLIGCTFEGNHLRRYYMGGAVRGGVIKGDVNYAYGNTFRSNSVEGDVSGTWGLLIHGNCGVVERNLFYNNLCYEVEEGGLIYGHIEELKENTIILKGTRHDWEGPWADTKSHFTSVGTAEHNIIVNHSNIPVFDTTGVSVPTLVCNDIITPGAPLSRGPYIDGGGNISADPQFCDTLSGEFTVADSSPCLFAPCGAMGAFGAGCGPAPCSILHVPTAEYPTVQSAVDNAAVCDTIMLAPGTYTGEGNREIDFHGKSLVLTSSHGADSTVFVCGDYSAFRLSGTEDTTAVISDVTLTGTTEQTALRCGSDGLTLARVKVVNNRGTEERSMAGVSLGRGTYLIKDCLFNGNRNDYPGAGIAISSGGRLRIERTEVSNTFSGENGGGAISNSGEMTIVDSIIRDNYAFDGWIGAIGNSGELRLIRCEIRDNRASHWAGAIGGGVNLMQDCLVTGNSSGYRAGAIRGHVDSLIGCTFEGNYLDGGWWDDTGTGGAISGYVGYAYGNTFRNNRIENGRDNNSGFVISGDCGVLEKNLFVDNYVEYAETGGLIYGHVEELRGNTIILDGVSQLDALVPVTSFFTSVGVAKRNIIVNLSEIAVFDSTVADPPTLVCNDIVTPGAPLTLSPYIDGGGNIAMDPRFCDPGNGDFTLSSISPALHQACGVMGAFGEGCSSEVPGFTGVNDVGADQGGSIRLTWARSQWDAPDDSITITGYAVYRLQVPGLAPPMALPVDAPERANALPAWDYLLTVPARGQVLYQTIISTLCDSTVNEGACWSTFFVSAMTPDPLVYYDSAPDSGYSKDNLAPTAPGNVQVEYHTGSGNHITWDPVTAPDFDYYRVYRRNDTEEVGVVVHSTTNTEWSDPSYDGPGVIYTVAGVDDSGNEGPHGGAQTATAVRETPTPEHVTLYQNVPNPFNPTTSIRYYVPEATDVTLRIFDATGKVVRDLVDTRVPSGEHEARWHGLNNHGQRVSSGIYFYRLIAGNVVETRKMVLLK